MIWYDQSTIPHNIYHQLVISCYNSKGSSTNKDDQEQTLPINPSTTSTQPERISSVPALCCVKAEKQRTYKAPTINPSMVRWAGSWWVNNKEASRWEDAYFHGQGLPQNAGFSAGIHRLSFRGGGGYHQLPGFVNGSSATKWRFGSASDQQLLNKKGG